MKDRNIYYWILVAIVGMLVIIGYYYAFKEKSETFENQDVPKVEVPKLPPRTISPQEEVALPPRPTDERRESPKLPPRN